jgi:hypothetical protein
MTMVAGPHNTTVWRAMVLKSGLGLMTVGIKPNRAWTKRGALASANAITGAADKTYLGAIASLEKWIAAHPMYNNHENEVSG